VGVGAAYYGFRREKGSARTILTIAGSLMAVVFAFLAYEFLASPSVWGGNPLAYGYIALTFVGGMAIYLASKSYHGRDGLDISLLFKEIPPE
jgi:hypothetical protein